MTDAERAEARRTNTRTLQTILQGSFDLLVLVEGKSSGAVSISAQ